MNKRMAKFFAICAMAVTCVCLSTPAFAQYRTSIQGVVTDPQGAVVPGATLTLTNLSTNETVIRKSGEGGVFNFNALTADRFSLVVEQAGFKKKVLDNLQLIPEQANALTVELEVGATSETVSVDASAAPAIDTQTASITGTITSNQVEHMPSFGRDVFQLIQLAPGVFGDGAQGGGGSNQNIPGTQSGAQATGGSTGIFATENLPAVVANGNQVENNSITIDGISTTSAVWGGSTIITPSEESVGNIKIVSNGYDAENGRFSGAQIQVTSKSGSNQYHGSAFFQAHRAGLNAKQRFNGEHQSVTKDNNRFNQFGGSVGGPIWKDKIFAFFAYETVRNPNSPNIANGWYETSAFDASAPAGSIAATYLTFPGAGVRSIGINPSTCLDAGLTENVNCRTIAGKGLDIGSPLKTALGTQDLSWVSPGQPGVGGGLDGVADIANFITSSNTTSRKVQYNGRLDANISGKDRIGFAIYWVPQTSSFLNGPARGYNFFHHEQINEAYSAIWNHTFSPTFLNEARANAAGWHWNEVGSNPQQPVGLPQDSIGNIGSIGAINSFGASVGSILNQWTYSYKDVATKVIGRHTIKFGGEVTRLYYLNECAPCGVPNYNFFNIWDFLNDAPRLEGGNFDPRTGIPTTLRQDDRENIWGFFVHDDFKVRRNLTLNIGLRYSYYGPLSAKQGNLFVASFGSGADLLNGLTVRKGGNLWNAQKGNFGPQIGFAWSPYGDDKVVIRGGYGLNYNQEEIAISANVQGNPGLVVSPTLQLNVPTDPNPGIIYATSTNVHSLTSYPANPNTVSTFGSNGLPTTGQVRVSVFPANLPTMMTHHYSLDTQYDLGHQFVATLGYQGSLSRHTFFHENPNAVAAVRGIPLNPQVGGGDFWTVSGSGNYNAMLAGLKHQFSHQFMADAEFAWAKSMDTSSAPYSEQDYPYDLGLNYGRSDYNVGKAFKLYALWQPVLFHDSHSWMEKLIGGWSLSGILNVHSGFPWTPVVSVINGQLYCSQCDYTQLLPAAYLGGAGNSTSNDQFKTGSNFPLAHSTDPKSPHGAIYFSKPTYTVAAPFPATGGAVPQPPGVRRNSLTGPGYRDIDATLAKSFGMPNIPGVGEGAKLEFRVDAYNLFNFLNFNPTSISNNVDNSNFGVAQSALGARTVSMQLRFSF